MPSLSARLRVRVGLTGVAALVALLVVIDPGLSQPGVPRPGGGFAGTPPGGMPRPGGFSGMPAMPTPPTGFGGVPAMPTPPAGFGGSFAGTPPGGFAGTPAGIGGVPAMPTPPAGFAGTPAGGFAGTPATPAFPAAPAVGMPPTGLPAMPGGAVTEKVWACDKCGHVCGTGPTPPSMTKCPSCGVRFGYIKDDSAPGGPTVRPNPASSSSGDDSATSRGLKIGGGIGALAAVIGGIVAMISRGGSSKPRKKAVRRPLALDDDRPARPRLDGEDRPRRPRLDDEDRPRRERDDDRPRRRKSLDDLDL